MKNDRGRVGQIRRISTPLQMHSLTILNNPNVEKEEGSNKDVELPGVHRSNISARWMDKLSHIFFIERLPNRGGLEVSDLIRAENPQVPPGPHSRRLGRLILLFDRKRSTGDGNFYPNL